MDCFGWSLCSMIKIWQALSTAVNKLKSFALFLWFVTVIIPNIVRCACWSSFSDSISCVLGTGSASIWVFAATEIFDSALQSTSVATTYASGTAEFGISICQRFGI